MDFHKNTKGRNNKLKIGQKVALKPETLNWQVTRLSWLYGACMHGKDAYSPGEKEILEENFKEIYALLSAKLKNKMPTGIIEGYGSEDYDDNGKPLHAKKNVFVSFTFKTDIGKVVKTAYFSERNLVKLK